MLKDVEEEERRKENIGKSIKEVLLSSESSVCSFDLPIIEQGRSEYDAT